MCALCCTKSLTNKCTALRLGRIIENAVLMGMNMFGWRAKPSTWTNLMYIQMYRSLQVTWHCTPHTEHFSLIQQALYQTDGHQPQQAKCLLWCWRNTWQYGVWDSHGTENICLYFEKLCFNVSVRVDVWLYCDALENYRLQKLQVFFL